MKLLILLYIFINIVAPITYGMFPNFTLFGNEFYSAWFTRDITYTLGLLISPTIGFERNRQKRIDITIVFVIEAILQLACLLFFDNNFNLILTIIHSIFFLSAIIFIYKYDK